MVNDKFKNVMKNLDKFRGTGRKKIEITKEQAEFLNACRDHESPIAWETIAELWAEAGWGQLSHTNIRTRYKMIQVK